MSDPYNMNPGDIQILTPQIKREWVPNALGLTGLFIDLANNITNSLTKYNVKFVFQENGKDKRVIMSFGSSDAATYYSAYTDNISRSCYNSEANFSFMGHIN